jgi:hypothetical protein
MRRARERKKRDCVIVIVIVIVRGPNAQSKCRKDLISHVAFCREVQSSKVVRHIPSQPVSQSVSQSIRQSANQPISQKSVPRPL